MRIMLRRWWLTLPLLAVTGLLVLQYQSSLDDVYASQATITVQPPSVVTTDAGLRPSNPLLQSEPKSTVIALAGVLNSASYHAAAEAEGFGGYDLVVTGSSLDISATGSDPDQAQRTSSHVVSLFQVRLEALQTSLSIPTQQRLQAREILAPTVAVNQGTGGVQALIALAGAGVLLTVTLTVAVDALLLAGSRRRARRADGGAHAKGSATTLPVEPSLAPAEPTPVPVSADVASVKATERVVSPLPQHERDRPPVQLMRRQDDVSLEPVPASGSHTT